MLYFTTLNDREDRRNDEAFSFGLLCCAAANKQQKAFVEFRLILGILTLILNGTGKTYLNIIKMLLFQII